MKKKTETSEVIIVLCECLTVKFRLWGKIALVTCYLINHMHSSRLNYVKKRKCAMNGLMAMLS